MRAKNVHSWKPEVIFSAMPTPTFDDFENVLLSAMIANTGTCIAAEVSTEDARKYAAEIISACEKVEAENE